MKWIKSDYLENQEANETTAPVDYFNQTFTAFQRVRTNSDVSPEFYFQIDRYIIRLVFAGDVLFSSMSNCFKHLEVEPAAKYDLTVYCWDSVSTRSSAPPLGGFESGLKTGNDISFFNKGGIYILYYHASKVLNIVNSNTDIALFWIPDHGDLPHYETASALKNILRCWFHRQHYYLVHSAVVGQHEQGILIVGGGGSGKSTTALAGVLDGLKYGGDDYILISRKQGYWAHSLYNSVKLENNNLSHYFEIKPEFLYIDESGKNKMVIFLNQLYPERISKRFRIKAIVVPHIYSGSVTFIEKISASKIFKALAPSTIFQHIGPDDRIIQFLASLTREIPGFRLNLSPNLDQIPVVLKKLIEDIKDEV